MTTPATPASITKCSKKAGEYCRLHNPKGVVSQQVFFSTSTPAPRNLAATVLAPKTSEELAPEWNTAKAELEANPTDSALHVKHASIRREFSRTLMGLKAIVTEMSEKRKELLAYAKSRGILEADLTMHVYGYEGIPEDRELGELYSEEQNLADRWDYSASHRRGILNDYLKKLISAEFKPTEVEDAKVAVLARYSNRETSDGENLTGDHILSAEDQAFWKRVTAPAFAKRLGNVEEAYLSAATEKKAEVSKLKVFADDRLSRVNRKSISEDDKNVSEGLLFLSHEPY